MWRLKLCHIKSNIVARESDLLSVAYYFKRMKISTTSLSSHVQTAAVKNIPETDFNCNTRTVFVCWAKIVNKRQTLKGMLVEDVEVGDSGSEEFRMLVEFQNTDRDENVH